MTSYSMTVQWEAVDCIHRNGDKVSYWIQYEEVESGVTLQIQPIFSSNVTNSYLRSSTTYSIEVAAVNSAGTGPYSPPVIVTTNKSKYNESK